MPYEKWQARQQSEATIPTRTNAIFDALDVYVLQQVVAIIYNFKLKNQFV